MNTKQKNVSALNKEQVAYIKGCSILQTAVWRITHRDPLKAIGNSISGSLFKNAVLIMMSAREKNRANILREALKKWLRNANLLNALLEKRRVLLKHSVLNKDSKLKNLLSKYFQRWKSVYVFPKKKFLKNMGHSLKCLIY